MQGLVRAHLSVLLNALHIALWLSGYQQGAAYVTQNAAKYALQSPLDTVQCYFCLTGRCGLPLDHVDDLGLVTRAGRLADPSG